MRDKETITIPLNKVSYEDLEALTIEQQTQLFVKDKEIERLHSIIKEVREFIEKYSIMYEHEIEPYKVVESEELLEILDKEKQCTNCGLEKE